MGLKIGGSPGVQILPRPRKYGTTGMVPASTSPPGLCGSQIPKRMPYSRAVKWVHNVKFVNFKKLVVMVETGWVDVMVALYSTTQNTCQRYQITHKIL